MAIALDQTTFKRLVWLYIAALIVSVAAFIPQLMSDRWVAFAEAFDALVAERFGGENLPDAAWIAVGAVMLIGIA